MKIDLTPLLQAVITLCSALISIFLVPYLKNKFGSQKLEEARKWTEKAVKAAEVLLPDSPGSDKLKYVQKFLNDKGYTFNDEELEVLIHDEVYNLWNNETIQK